VKLVEGHASYAFYDENTAGRMLSPADLPDLPAEVRALFFGGISLVAEPCGSAYEALCRREAGARLVMIDPNIRPGFIADEPAYRARLARMIALADIVKLSDEDLTWLEGSTDLDAMAQAVLARGPKLLFVTEGAKGAHGFSVRDRVFAPSRRVTVADTVGAGDTFNAGVLAALDRAGILAQDGALAKEAVATADAGLIRACLDLGVAAAAITVSRAGANPPWASELS